MSNVIKPSELTLNKYGKLSDIFGRKALLLIAYSFYCVGGLLGSVRHPAPMPYDSRFMARINIMIRSLTRDRGLGFSFWSVLIGRAIAGIGNAGITVLISTLIVGMASLGLTTRYRLTPCHRSRAPGGCCVMERICLCRKSDWESSWSISGRSYHRLLELALVFHPSLTIFNPAYSRP